MNDQPNLADNRPHRPLHGFGMAALSSHNQHAKWGVSKFGTLSPFESQPPRSDFLGPTAKCRNDVGTFVRRRVIRLFEQSMQSRRRRLPWIVGQSLRIHTADHPLQRLVVGQTSFA